MPKQRKYKYHQMNEIKFKDGRQHFSKISKNSGRTKWTKQQQQQQQQTIYIHK